MIIVRTEAERLAAMQAMIALGWMHFVCFRYGRSYGLTAYKIFPQI